MILRPTPSTGAGKATGQVLPHLNDKLAEGNFKTILEYTQAPLVSADFIGIRTHLLWTAP